MTWSFYTIFFVQNNAGRNAIADTNCHVVSNEQRLRKYKYMRAKS